MISQAVVRSLKHTDASIAPGIVSSPESLNDGVLPSLPKTDSEEISREMMKAIPIPIPIPASARYVIDDRDMQTVKTQLPWRHAGPAYWVCKSGGRRHSREARPLLQFLI